MRTLSLASLLAAFALSAAGLCAGCAADTTDSSTTGGEVDELNASGLRAATTIKGTLSAGTQATVRYDAEDAEYTHGIPYVAVELLPQDAAHASSIHPLNGNAASTQKITVSGAFPGSPKVLVVDEAFHVVAHAMAKPQADGTELATLDAPKTAGRRFVLTRDGRWSKPMAFKITASQ
jgi:hypothetical protein